MSDDFFGGMYDFNRDGETDLSEQAIGMQMLMNNLNGDDKDYDDESWSEYFEKRRAAKAQKVKPEPIKFTPPPVPECPTREEYKAYKKRLRSEIGAHLFAAAVPSVPAAILSWATISTMAECNETLGVIVCLIILIIIWVIAGAMITGAFSGFGDVLERGQKLKENYKNAKKNNMIPLKKAKKEKGYYWKAFKSFCVKLLIILIVLFPLWMFVLDWVRTAIDKERVEKDVIAICEEYGLTDITTNTYFTTSFDIPRYEMTVTANGDINDRNRDFFEFIKRLDDVNIDINVFWGEAECYPRFISACYKFNGNVYDLDDGNLEKNGNQIQLSDYETSLKERCSGKMPWEGMNVEGVKYTLIGSPHETKTRNRTETYYWYNVQGYSKIIAYVGTNDITNTKRINKISYYGGSNNTTTKYNSSGYKPSNDDPYNAKSYRNAEDFYDDNYYDFFDYYDAEKYYNEHHD